LSSGPGSLSVRTMSGTHVFGYGSLVNARTHGFGAVEPARLSGFRRVWQPSPLRRLAYLTVVPGDGAVLGATAAVPPASWPELDERERAYRRHALPGPAIGGREGVQVYAVAAVVPPHPGQPILLSYIDVVVQGFLEVHGVEGVRDFFASTAGWETPVLDDRAAPRYARAQSVSDAERAHTDEGLATVGAGIVRLSPEEVDDLWNSPPMAAQPGP